MSNNLSRIVVIGGHEINRAALLGTVEELTSPRADLGFVDGASFTWREAFANPGELRIAAAGATIITHSMGALALHANGHGSDALPMVAGEIHLLDAPRPLGPMQFADRTINYGKVLEGVPGVSEDVQAFHDRYPGSAEAVNTAWGIRQIALRMLLRQQFDRVPDAANIISSRLAVGKTGLVGLGVSEFDQYFPPSPVEKRSASQKAVPYVILPDATHDIMQADPERHIGGYFRAARR